MCEARATAEAASVVRILNDASMDPSTKRFVKGRPARIDRWTQLANIASQQVQGLQALAKAAAPKRVVKAKANSASVANLPFTTSPATSEALDNSRGERAEANS